MMAQCPVIRCALREDSSGALRASGRVHTGTGIQDAATEIKLGLHLKRDPKKLLQ